MIGNSFELWLENRWDELLGRTHTSIVTCVERTNRFLSDFRRGILNTDGKPLADFLCSLGFVDSGQRYGPWSVMSDSEWKVIARITELQCWERDAEWWNRQ